MELTRQAERNGVTLAYLKAIEENQVKEKLAETIKGIKSASEQDEPAIFTFEEEMGI
jgi:hypothetical protein